MSLGKETTTQALIAETQEGVLAGSQASEIPESFGVNGRLGYIKGLETYLSSRGVDISSLPSHSFELITNDGSIFGFNKGLRREAPQLGRNYALSYAQYPEIYLKHLPSKQEGDLLRGLRRRVEDENTGYVLGFIVGVLKDYNVVLNTLEAPQDNPSFEAFASGLQAKPRVLKEPDDPKKFDTKNPYRSMIETYDTIDELAYSAGLRVWIKSLGLKIDTWKLRHPASLNAFKAALEGTGPDETGDSRHQTTQPGTYTSKFLFPSENIKNSTDFSKAPNPYETYEYWRNIGSALGKKAILLLASRQQTSPREQ